MKRQIFGPCYDPYHRGQRPTKGHWSLNSMFVSTISTVAYELFGNTTTAQPPTAVASFNEKQLQHHHSRRRPLFRGRDIDFTHFKTSYAYRMQKAERFIREQDYDILRDPSAWGLPPGAADNYRLAVEEEDSRWGLVYEKDLEVCFLAPIPSPEPKRTYIIIPEAPTPPAVPVGHPRTCRHLFHNAVVLS
ncbi:hypothetical protein BDB00DRAFT_795104, partial [Zychaea mexicana]|uniref:uncharacterized protein n=1 Tax=Zychaea mexicana TaxID=64656 RepID=UPI0022FE0BB0